MSSNHRCCLVVGWRILCSSTSEIIGNGSRFNCLQCRWHLVQSFRAFYVWIAGFGTEFGAGCIQFTLIKHCNSYFTYSHNLIHVAGLPSDNPASIYLVFNLFCSIIFINTLTIYRLSIHGMDVSCGGSACWLVVFCRYYILCVDCNSHGVLYVVFCLHDELFVFCSEFWVDEMVLGSWFYVISAWGRRRVKAGGGWFYMVSAGGGRRVELGDSWLVCDENDSWMRPNQQPELALLQRSSSW